MANARYMKDYLLPHGWIYIVVDFRWYDPVATHNDNDLTRQRMRAKLNADKFGRMLPGLNRFPSAANGQGVKPLADKLHAKDGSKAIGLFQAGKWRRRNAGRVLPHSRGQVNS